MSPIFELVRLSSEHDLSDFSCGDDELDGFLGDDALDYQGKFLANTTLLVQGKKIISFFALIADAIQLTKEEKTAQGILTRFSSFPALKIARLATDEGFQGQGYGTEAVKFCIGLARHLNNRHLHDGIGCRFVTVDAYLKSVGFYKNKFGFVENERMKLRDTVSLRLDILPIRDIAP